MYFLVMYLTNGPGGRHVVVEVLDTASCAATKAPSRVGGAREAFGLNAVMIFSITWIGNQPGLLAD
jgi:hypothetical protein